MADKGIRPYANAKFLALLPNRENTRLGNRNFRATINADLMEQFGIPLHSAATAYNNAFIEAKKIALTDETVAKLLDGLGRAEDKKGGRKPKPKVEAATVAPAAPPAPVVTGTEASDAGETDAVQTVFKLLKKKDNSVVAEGLSFEDAKAAVEESMKPFKARLYYV